MPVWLDLPGGDRLLADVMNPLAGIASRRAQTDALLAAHEEGRKPDLVSIEMDAIAEVARRIVRDWQGVLHEDGEPVPCTPDMVELYIRTVDGAALAFDRAWGEARRRLREEKKSSGTSPAGTGTPTPDPASADAAPTSAPPAPTTSRGAARTRGTRPRATRRRSSGTSSAAAPGPSAST